MLAGVVAAPGNVDAASVSLTWNAPTTNADGTPLTDLANYRVYLATTAPACPGASFLTVSSPASTPPAGQTVASRVTALTAGATYLARITAVDGAGNESSCSPSASGVAQVDFSVTPTATTDFGSVTVGGQVDRSFTVQNASTASVSGTTSVGSPYSVVAGGSFTLAAGASQVVTVRFRPTAAGTFAGNVNVTVGADTLSRGMTGSATAVPMASLAVTMSGTGAGAVTSAPTGISCGAICTASVPVGTPMTLTAAPTSGSMFASWGGACSGTALSCAWTMNVNATVTATFNTTRVDLPLAGVPVVSSLAPASAPAGSGATTLTVNGSGFAPTSVVRWDGATRTTTVVSSTQLRAALTAADLATARSALVSVFTPTPGGGTSGTLGFTVAAVPAVPVASSLAPASAVAGGTGTTLTVTGNSFVASSEVRWNGARRTTTFVSANQLRAAITASDLTTPGTVAVSVLTPSPGGGTSGTVSFAIIAPPVPPVPSGAQEIIIDNADPGVQDAAGGRTFSGAWCLSSATNKFGRNSLYSCGSDMRDTYRWTPRIPVSGDYNVYVWIATTRFRSSSVPITVVHTAGGTSRWFDERTGGGTWVLHGRYTFAAGTAGYVQTSDRNGMAGADAVRFVPVPTSDQNEMVGADAERFVSGD